tara:strand:- start:640 stop:999 length:360 start_codon:yes stop_codon:yes gene_type:complete
MKTLFLDIDGCLLHSWGRLDKIVELPFPPPDDYLLPGVKEKFHEWYFKNYNIVLTTGRPESMRGQTHKQLQYFGLHYDHLIMGLKHCPRVLINDKKSDGKTCAEAIEVEKNAGLIDLDV